MMVVWHHHARPAQVYKANLDGNVREVAVKFLAPPRDDEDAIHHMRKFAKEVSVLHACRDASIVSFLGAWLQQVCAWVHT